MPPQDLVRRLLLALGRGDVDGFLSGLADDVAWSSGGVLLPRGEFHGRDEVRRGLHQATEERGEMQRLILRELDAADRRVLVLGAVEAEKDHRATTMPSAWIFELEEGTVAKVTGFTSDTAAKAEWRS